MKLLGITAFFLIATCVLAEENKGACAGCPVEKDKNDEHIKKLLLSAVTKQNAKSNSEELSVVSINKVTSQVVAGIKYTVDYDAEGQRTKKLYNCHTVLVHQAWLDPEPQVIEYTCNAKKAKRSVWAVVSVDRSTGRLQYLSVDVGGPKDLRPEELDQVKELAQMGIETLDELDADDFKRVIINFIEAKKQLVNGIMYHVTVEVKTTSCSENGDVNEECLSDEVGPQKLCNLQIYRSFADKSPNNAKVVKSECDSIKNGRSLDLYESENSVHLNDIVSYGIKMINNALNSFTVKGLVNILETNHAEKDGAHVTSLTLELGDTNCTKRVSSDNLFCKVIPEVKNHLICHLAVVHDKEAMEMKIHSNDGLGGFNCKNLKDETALSNRARRALLGAERPLTLSHERLDELKDFISSVLSSSPGVLHYKAVASVISSSYRIMSGRMLTMTVEVADTDCKVGSGYDEEQCPIKNEGRRVCKMIIWEKPWLDMKELVENECYPIEPNHEILGVEEDDEHLLKFRNFTVKYNKSYSTVRELSKRFKIFRANMKKVDYLQKTEQGTATYGATMFADLSSKEFKTKYLGLKVSPNSGLPSTAKQAVIPDIELPNEFDWRNYNIVTPVKNQGMCGSCWAFSVTGNIEGLYAKQTGQLISLSEQELVDCDHYDEGCNGGMFDTAYKAIEDIGGLESEGDYPYTGLESKSCKFNRSEVRVSISGSVNISSDETDMAKWLVANGPISIALNANAMQFYFGGVSHPLKFLCSPKDLDHGVLIVGYGVHKTWLLKKQLPYWLIKNSWGTWWGHKGYYMLYRGDGSCGVNQAASSAVL